MSYSRLKEIRISNHQRILGKVIEMMNREERRAMRNWVNSESALESKYIDTRVGLAPIK
jgi:hypothetical protein